MSRSDETRADKRSLARVWNSWKTPEPVGSGDSLAGNRPDLFVEAAWVPVPPTYDWFGELDPDGLPDCSSFLDGKPANPKQKEAL
jgi:hypothetical protein